ncbi:MAG: rhomboid family intramembrane serine protease [Rhodobacterales bacterium]|nr:MAG: rhomboid family intramembrane serine protease [Rhodobacterales bacterium]
MNDRPVNPLPPLVLAVFIVLALIEAALSLGSAGVLGGAEAVGWRVALIDRLAFAPRVQELVWRGNWEPQLLARYVSYPLVHVSFTHAAFACALWLALGKFVGELYRPLALAVITLAAVIGGAVVYGVYGSLIGRNMALVGAYPAVYGLIGAYTYLMWLRLGQIGDSPAKAFRLIGVLMGLQLTFAMLFGSDPSWTADLAGFIFGGIAAILVAPGGWKAFLRRMRRD